MDAHDPLYPVAAQFPLGRRFGDEGSSPREGGHLVPFGARLAVVPQLIPVDLAPFRYHPDRQIGLVEDGGGVLVPLVKHSTGVTHTNTASSDKAPSDTDRDYTED